ncbi:PAS domain-containing sensor histidine kinase [Flavobacterium aquicola]|uniref:histidine kinase n=1 Tax=Flavobacterium aquicola TaxID=1682742 RepID=A0A3E0E739_9FLAO|nr:PAS domain-containing sensor histidine kinase [Flavobacterium aquicola]REG94068.1 PAS domain S-box-containing protein [Flavobacterium aquicola]
MIFTANKNPEDLNKLYESLIKQLPNIIFQIRVNSDKQIAIDFLSKPIEFLDEFSINEFLEDSYKLSNYKIYEPDFKMFLDSYEKAISSNEKWEIDFRLLMPESGYKWIRIDATPKKNDQGEMVFYGLISDITIVKEQEIRLKVADERYHFAVQASDRGVWDWDLITNKVYYSSESMKILEITESDLVAAPEEWDERVHPDDREEYYGNINLHFDNKIPFYETCHRVLCSGKYKWILDRGKVIERDGNGKPLRIVGTHTDISEQKEKEIELAKMLEIVNTQNNKLLNFAHIVSHNLRTHSGNIKSLLDLHKENLLSDSDTLSNIQIVSDELFSTIENLNDLVSIYAEREDNMQLLKINGFIDKVLDVLYESIRLKRIQVLNYVPNSVKILCIPAYLESIMLNLVTNAIKYSDPDKESKIIFTAEVNDEFVILNVKDNGLGIDLEKHKESIFGLYKTFHRNNDARGVGLYLTKNQVENMGGKIEVESTLNFGSTFKVYFKKE